MATMTAQTESDPPRRTSVSLRLLAVSVGLPMVIVLIDQQVIAACETMFKLRAFLPILFVAQVGVLAACAGRFVENAFLRFVVFAWSLALVDSLALAHLLFGILAYRWYARGQATAIG